MSLTEILAMVLTTGVSVLLAAQGWVMRQIHSINILLSRKHAEYDVKFDEMRRTIDRLESAKRN